MVIQIVHLRTVNTCPHKSLDVMMLQWKSWMCCWILQHCQSLLFNRKKEESLPFPLSIYVPKVSSSVLAIKSHHFVIENKPSHLDPLQPKCIGFGNKWYKHAVVLENQILYRYTAGEDLEFGPQALTSCFMQPPTSSIRSFSFWPIILHLDLDACWVACCLNKKIGDYGRLTNFCYWFRIFMHTGLT